MDLSPGIVITPLSELPGDATKSLINKP